MAMKTPPHPGRLVKGAMDELDLSVAEGADALGISALSFIAWWPVRAACRRSLPFALRR